MSNSLAVQRVLIYYDDESARRSTVIRQLLTNRLTTSSRFWGDVLRVIGYRQY